MDHQGGVRRLLSFDSEAIKSLFEVNFRYFVTLTGVAKIPQILFSIITFAILTGNIVTLLSCRLLYAFSGMTFIVGTIILVSCFLSKRTAEGITHSLFEVIFNALLGLASFIVSCIAMKDVVAIKSVIDNPTTLYPKDIINEATIVAALNAEKGASVLMNTILTATVFGLLGSFVTIFHAIISLMSIKTTS